MFLVTSAQMLVVAAIVSRSLVEPDAPSLPQPLAASDVHSVAPAARCHPIAIRRTILKLILNSNTDPDSCGAARHAAAAAHLDRATVRYGDVVALAGATATFVGGTTTALVGANGSGKSTVLKLLAGLVQPSHGTVHRASGAGVMFVAQQHGQHRWMPLSVREVLRMGTYRRTGLLGRARPRDHAEVARVAAWLEVSDLLARGFGDLSGGQQQRVLVAQALIGSPELLLLDEPITGLDLASQATILRVMAEHATRGGTVVFSTHHLAEARRADRVVLLAGEVLGDGSPDEVLRPELLAAAFGGRLLRLDESSMLLDDHGHGTDAGG
jgi:manganese transport system ATP-binding protein